jgi:hypothetical protein
MQLLSSVFLPMLAGHFVADFWLQPTSWVRHKKSNGWKSGKLLIHSIIGAILPVLFTLQVELWWFVPLIFGTHFLTDAVKLRFKDSVATFLIDQMLHISVLLVLATFVTQATIPEKFAAFWVYAVGFILVTNPLGILTGMFLKSVTKSESISAKLDASAWIGIFERVLIVIFILMSQVAAIGFLVAAKSIFRFSDTQKDGNKKAEYFLLGTLVSFATAVIVGLTIQYLVLL